MPIVGNACASDEDTQAPSRILESFALGFSWMPPPQPPEAVRAFGDLLARVVLSEVDLSSPIDDIDDADLLLELVRAIGQSASFPATDDPLRPLRLEPVTACQTIDQARPFGPPKSARRWRPRETTASCWRASILLSTPATGRFSPSTRRATCCPATSWSTTASAPSWCRPSSCRSSSAFSANRSWPAGEERWVLAEQQVPPERPGQRELRERPARLAQPGRWDPRAPAGPEEPVQQVQPAQRDPREDRVCPARPGPSDRRVRADQPGRREDRGRREHREQPGSTGPRVPMGPRAPPVLRAVVDPRCRGQTS